MLLLCLNNEGVEDQLTLGKIYKGDVIVETGMLGGWWEIARTDNNEEGIFMSVRFRRINPSEYVIKDIYAI